MEEIILEHVNLKPLYVLIDKDGNLATKKSGNGGLPVFQTQHTAAVNQRHWRPKYFDSESEDLKIVKFKEATK